MFEWLEACERSFQKLKVKLISSPLLTLSKGTKGFATYCDASSGFGWVHIQHCKVIVYASIKLKAHEKKNPTHDLELVVVVFSLKICSCYLYGVHVDVLTDHNSIQYVFTQKGLQSPIRKMV